MIFWLLGPLIRALYRDRILGSQVLNPKYPNPSLALTWVHKSSSMRAVRPASDRVPCTRLRHRGATTVKTVRV